MIRKMNGALMHRRMIPILTFSQISFFCAGVSFFFSSDAFISYLPITQMRILFYIYIITQKHIFVNISVKIFYALPFLPP